MFPCPVLEEMAYIRAKRPRKRSGQTGAMTLELSSGEPERLFMKSNEPKAPGLLGSYVSTTTTEQMTISEASKSERRLLGRSAAAMAAAVGRRLCVTSRQPIGSCPPIVHPWSSCRHWPDRLESSMR